MIKTVELFKFKKKQELFDSKNNKEKKEKYSSKNEKDYSRLFIKILNSTKLNKSNIKVSKGIEHKKNNIKKITLFNPEENKYNQILRAQKRVKTLTGNSQELRNKQIKKNNSKNKNINKKQYLSKDNSKHIINMNKFKSIIKNENKEEKKDKNKKINKDINKINNIIKKKNEVINKNLTEKNLKKKSIFQKEKALKKEENNINYRLKNEESKKEGKNSLKKKKIDIMNDNNISFDKKKGKIGIKNNKLNYIFKQNLNNNNKVPKLTYPHITKVSKRDKTPLNNNNLSKENKRERIIDESLKIIDSFTAKNNTINYDINYNKTNINKKKKFYTKYINTDIYQSVPKLSNYNIEMNSMNNSQLKGKKCPSELNNNCFNQLSLDSSRKKKNELFMNKSENFKIKIKQKIENNHSNKKIRNSIKNDNNKIKNIKININKKPNVKKIESTIIHEDGKSRAKYPNYYFRHYTDNDIGIYSEESYFCKNENFDILKRNSMFNKENNQFHLNKERNDRRKKHETVRNNIDNIGRKLLILVNEFHNEPHHIVDSTFNFHSKKLIDRIRAFKKMNNI